MSSMAKHILVATLPTDKLHEARCLHGSVFVTTLTATALQSLLLHVPCSGTKWLVFIAADTLLGQEFIADVNIPFGCRFLAAQSEGDSGRVTLTEVFNFPPTLPPQMYRVADWCPDRGFTWYTSPFRQKMVDLQGAVIKGAYIFDPPFVNSPLEEGHPDYMHNLWREMERRMNFTTVYLRTEDRILGYKDQNGAWRGVVNELVTRKADVGINLLAMTTERLEAIDFLPPILNDRMMVHIRKDKMEISTVRHILSPFALKLWLAVSLVIIVFAVLLAVTAAVNLKYSHEKVLTLRHFSLQNSWWCVLGIFCQQGQDITPRSWSCRLVHATLCLTAAVLFAAYSATFVSFLTVRRYELPFTDFRGLLKNGKYRLGILHGSSTTNYFQKATDPILLDVYKKLIQPNKDSFVADDIEGLRNVCHSHNYAYVISIYNSIPALSKYIHCSITGVPEAYYSYTASIIITKDNPYKKLFQRRVLEMRRSGILNRIRKDAWWEDFEDDFRGASAGGTTLDTVTVFYHILAAGLLLSTFLVVLEKLWWKMRVQFRNKS